MIRKWMPIPIWGEGGEQIIGWGRVSPDDYPRVKMFKWWVVDGYMAASITVDGFKTTMLLHRYVMGAKIGDGDVEVDHIDRNRINNVRENLRFTTRFYNEENHDRSHLSSGKRGVSFDKKTGKWRAQATLKGVYQHLGTYETEEEAIAARMAWEERHDRVLKAELDRLLPDRASTRDAITPGVAADDVQSG